MRVPAVAAQQPRQVPTALRPPWPRPPEAPPEYVQALRQELEDVRRVAAEQAAQLTEMRAFMTKMRARDRQRREDE